MRSWFKIVQNQEKLLQFHWEDGDGVLINYSSGYTFTFQLVSDGIDYLNKTSGILGFATSPNVLVALGTGELATVPAGIYEGRLCARKIADSTDDYFDSDDWPIVEVLAAAVVAP